LIESNPGSAPVAVDIDFGELRQIVVINMQDEVEMLSLSKTSVLDNCILVKDAAEYSCYCPHNLRQLLQLGKFAGLKLGQLWLIEMESFEWYLSEVGNSQDHRFGLK
jgi:hypothetical protein